MPYGVTRARTLSNVGAIFMELFGPMFLTIVGLGVAVPSFVVVLGPGAGLGLTVFVLTYVGWIRSGAHFNPGVTMAKAATWMTGLTFRDYFGRGLVLFDLVFAILYIGMQLVGAIIGIEFLKYIDKSGLIAATFQTVPNGNLAGDEGRALALAFMLNMIFIWVHLSALGPRSNAVTKQLGAPLVIGLTYGGVVIVSTYWGAGTVCNLALDLALSRFINANTPKKLWISAVGQVLGAIGAFVLYFCQAYLDRMLELQMLHGDKSAAANMDHERANSLRKIFVRYMERSADAASAAGAGEPLVAPHDTAPEFRAAHRHTHTRDASGGKYNV